ncbi:MAG: chromosome segregation SMC family protein [Nitrososphaerota archaeon]
MVYIKKLIIYGFKSFGPKRTIVELDKGLVAITGPNGGGKSNLFDAIRFSLGELSAHSLRVSKLSDLIYNIGEENRAQYAKVSIQLDNSDKNIPIDSLIVTISRKLYPSGESEYSINGKIVSRSDLLSILSVAGIRPSGFNIVPQGSVVNIAEMDPMELRKLLDEISGVSEYENKKNEAKIQLAIAEKNLEVAKASTNEVRARVKQLEIERNRCLRKHFIEMELKKYEATLLIKNKNEIEKNLNQLLIDLEKIKNNIQEIENEKNQINNLKILIEKNWNEYNSLIKDIEDFKLKDIENEYNKIVNIRIENENSISRLKTKEYLINEDLKHLEERLKVLDKKILEIQENINSLNILFEEKNKEKNILEKDYLEKKKQMDILNEETLPFKEKLNTIEEKINFLNKEIRNKEKEYEKIKSQNQYLEKFRNELEIRLNHFKEEFNEIEKNRNELIMKINELRIDIENKTKENDYLFNEFNNISSIIEKLKVLKNEVENLYGEIKIRNELNKENLIEKDFLNNFYNLILENKIEGIIGILKEEVSIDQNYAKICPFINDFLNYIIVKDINTARKLSFLLSLYRENNIKIIVKSLFDSFYKQNENLLNLEDDSFAKIFYAKNEDIKKILNILFEKFSIANSLKEVKNILNKGKIAITLDGNIYKPPGIIEFYTRKKDETYYFEEMDNLSNFLNQINSKLFSLEEKISKINSRIDNIEKEKIKSKTILEEYEKQLILLNDEYNKNINKINELEREIKSCENEFEITNQNLINIKENLDNSIKTYESLIKEKNELKEHLEDLYKKMNDLKILELENELENLENELEQIVFKRELAENRLKELNEEENSIIEKIEILKNEINENNKAILQIEKDLINIKEKEKRFLIEKENLMNLLKNYKEKRDNSMNELLSLNNKIKEIDEIYHKLSIEKESVQNKVHEYKTNITIIDSKLKSIGEVKTKALFINKAEKIIEELKNELNEIGLINELAPKQYEELIKNYKLRSERINQLENERLEIIRLMEEIDKEKLNVFNKFFYEISENFNFFFNKLTLGKARLKLENENAPLTSGIEMHLQFLDKPSRISSAVSGGEKSIAAIAFLLALQKLFPSTFYIFDEVDAHMDVKYTKSLADLFKEISKDTQLIVITLKDAIAEKSDLLIGVYSKDGVSNVVKTRLKYDDKNG